MRPPGKWALLALVCALALLADQWTKFLAVERLTRAFESAGAETFPQRVRAFYGLSHLEGLAREPYVVWRPVWRMNYVENPGAAWSLFRGMADDARQIFFGAITIAAVAFILHYYRRLAPGQRILQLALAAVLSGAVGNFIDRLARRYVIDFIEWHWWNRPDLRWPTFNLADSLIVVGVALLILHPAPKKAEKEP
jgi:signal peptidase II